MLSGNLPKVAVILGAGASIDCAGASPINPDGDDWTPPLAKRLFSNAALHPHIEQILNRYPGANVIRELIISRTSGTEVGIEEELRRIANTESLVSIYKYVPAYLRDYLAGVSRHYTTSPGAYAHLAVELLKETPHDVAFIVLNYDTFLEKALSFPPWNAEFDSVDAYLQPDQPFQVFKVHGSVNWAVHLETQGSNWNQAVEQFDLSLDDKEIVMFNSDHPIRDVFDQDRPYYPVLTAPSAGKTDSDLVCPKKHQIALKDFLTDCRKILIIGSSVLDADLLDLLREHAPKPKIIHYVSGNDSKKVRGNFERGVPQFKIPWASDINLAAEMTFGEYRLSEHFQNFVAASAS